MVLLLLAIQHPSHDLNLSLGTSRLQSLVFPGKEGAKNLYTTCEWNNCISSVQLYASGFDLLTADFYFIFVLVSLFVCLFFLFEIFSLESVAKRCISLMWR